jgi:hypothetical protein
MFSHLIAPTAAAAQIDRTTFYNWLKTDPEFKAAIEEAQPEEYYLDFVEDMLLQLIKQGNTAATIFALKTKGRGRGYIEQQNIVQTIESLPEIVLLPANTAKPPVYDEADVVDPLE